MADLFAEFRLRGVTFRNRIIVSPMCQYSSPDGFATDWHFVHLGSRAVGGAALVMTEAAAVTPDGRISPDDLGIWKDEHIPPLRRIIEFLRAQGAAAGVQLAHAGRKASTAAPWLGSEPLDEAHRGWRPVLAPSALPFSPDHPTPKAADQHEIHEVVTSFGKAAERALEAGFDVIEIHAAHGYLLHEFLSPLTNTRTDSYGGRFDHRLQLLCQVCEAVRRGWPDEKPLFVRLSVTDWHDEGWRVEDTVELVRRLRPLGVDLIDCSSGGIVPQVRIPAGPGYQTGFAERVRREAGVPTCAVGMITSPQQADTIIRTGQADMVMLARELLRQPYWPLLAARELGRSAPWPKQYERAK